MALERYNKFSMYLKERYGVRVHKIGVDAGFSCPNRDGLIGTGGCIFCDNSGFSYNTRIASRPLEKQIEEGICAAKKRFKAKKFIIYFQAYTNTYASLKVLKKRYNVVRKFEDIVGVSIATRPDVINEEILEYIESYTSDYEVWIEYGLQSIHSDTLKLINRGHSYDDFLKAVELTRKRNIKICVHIIIGLPDETEEQILDTAETLGKLKLDGIKIHPLYIIKGTTLEKIFNQGLYEPLGLDDYVDTVCGFLEYLWPDTVVQRITADCPKEILVAPKWILRKPTVLKGIENKLSKEYMFQGRLFIDETYY